MAKVSPDAAQQQPWAYGQKPTCPVGNAAPMNYFNENPVPVTCQFCGASVVTATEYKAGLVTWAAAAVICIIFPPLTWLGCCLIPFCIDALKDVEHTCPQCQRIVHKYNKA